MKTTSKLFMAVTAILCSVPLHAHEGHAIVGSFVHDLEHAGWIAGALMLGSVLILAVFSLSLRMADKHLTDKNRRDQ